MKFIITFLVTLKHPTHYSWWILLDLTINSDIHIYSQSVGGSQILITLPTLKHFFSQTWLSTRTIIYANSIFYTTNFIFPTSTAFPIALSETNNFKNWNNPVWPLKWNPGRNCLCPGKNWGEKMSTRKFKNKWIQIIGGYQGKKRQLSLYAIVPCQTPEQVRC